MKFRSLPMTLLGAGAILTICCGSAEARIFKVLHSFAGGSSDGAYPRGGVTPVGKDFVLTTDAGGQGNLGTITLVRSDGSSQVFHAFTADGNDGYGGGYGALADDGTLLYGTTPFGGADGCGTFFALHHDGSQYGIIHTFTCADGAFPYSDLTWGDDGLYFPTVNGGSNDLGTINEPFEGGLDFFDSFTGSNGSKPYGGLAYDPTSLTNYGTASAGGQANLGTIVANNFHGGGNITVLHSFAGGSDGSTPYGSLLLYKNVLYGTTELGGAGGNLGTVFRINPDSSGYTVLHAFMGICCGNSDGSFAFSGLTLNPKDGMLYGTTINGGGPSDSGTIFKIDPNTGAEIVVHAFKGRDGAHPYGRLYINARGKVYGATLQGGGLRRQR